MKKNKPYFFILIYSLLMIFIMLFPNKLFGSTIDWNTQHIVFPDYFRSLFYETHNLIPNLALGIGGGQNIFNLAYYGLLSPIILISYLLPFISMTNYIMIINIILYILTGILMYKWIKNNFNEKIALFSSLLILSIPTVLFQFHHHFMFIYYFPFLLLGLISIDHYLKTNKSLPLIICLTLIIFTNYYYAVPSLICLYIYALYKMDWNIKNLINITIRFLLSVGISSIILLPIFYTIKTGQRIESFTPLIDKFIMNYKEVLYNPYTAGLSSIFIISLIGIISTKKKNNKNVLLSIFLLLIIYVPLFMYILNGRLYIRGKVLIPFIPLYIYVVILFIKELFNKNINTKNYLIILVILLLFTSIRVSNIKYIIPFILSTITIYYLYKNNHKKILYIFILLVSLISSILVNRSEKYITKEILEDDNIDTITTLFNNIKDNTVYRSNNYHNNEDLMNRVFSNNYYGIDLYSSTYNDNYYNFYRSINNLSKRNVLMTTTSNNELFNLFMGVKYITSSSDPGPFYEKIDSLNNINLYKTNYSYPIIYGSDTIPDNETYNSLIFPYNIAYLMNYDNIQEYNWKDTYNTDVDELTIEQKIPKELQNKILFIDFNIENDYDCTDGDNTISINGVTNKLTCKDWRYKNNNYNFKYVIPTTDNNIIIKFSKGNYKLSNIHIYYTNINKYKSNNTNININKNKSEITTNINNNYLLTTIPYDEGFKVYVNNKEIPTFKIYNTFLGAYIEGGGKIRITYSSPFYKEGKIITIISIILLLGLLLIERKENN